MTQWYGVVVPDQVYHLTSLCPRLGAYARSRRGSEVAAYPREADAIIAGHVRRCPLCHSQYFFSVQVNDERREFLISKARMEVFILMARQHEANAPVNFGEMARTLGLDVACTTRLALALQSHSLVSAVARAPGCRKIPARRRLTSWGIAVWSAYKANLYHGPDNDLPAPAETINNRL